MSSQPRPVSVADLRAYAERGERFAMLTAYDLPTARALDEAGIPVLLVGDSVGDNMLGYESTLPVTVEAIIHHTRAVRRGVTRALVVADMPFGSYQVSEEAGMAAAVRLLKEGGANAVKLEGGVAVAGLVRRMVGAGIPVMGHVGLTPQSVNAMGGFKIQGRSPEGAERVLADAVALDEAGVFAVVVEGVPAQLGRRITDTISAPTIGIGAGPHTDGQVLVVNDVLGLSGRRPPRFVKSYADVRSVITDAAKAFAAEVASGDFPDAEHSY